MVKLIGDEQVITGADGPLCLTTHRVRFEGRSWGRQSVDEIFLEDLSYQALRMSSSPIYLVLAGMSVLLAAFGVAASTDAGPIALVGFISALVCTVAYALTRRQVLILSSSGGRIQLAASAIPREALDWFLLKLAEAKSRRFQGVRGVGVRAAAA